MIGLLNQSLAESLDLGLQTKQAHWNVRGTNFIALHELFDKLAESLEEAADELAERATALGGTAEGTLQAAAERTQLKPYPLRATAGGDHVRLLADAHAAFGKRLRASIDEAAGAGDQDTADLFTELSRGADKNLWFLEAHATTKK